MDLSYKLIVDMSTTGSLAPQLEKVGKAGDLSKVKDALGSMASSMGGLASGMAGLFTGAVEAVGGIAVGLAKVGAVAAGGALAYGVVGLNNELELTKTSIAAILNASGQSSGMTSALGMSADIIKTMRKDAAELPGEFKDLIGFFRLGSTPGFALGADVKQMEKLSANAMAAAAATGVNQEQAAREFAMLLQGRAGAHNVFGSLLGFTGEKAQSFNAASGTEKLKEVEAALGKFEPAIAEFATTFDALKSTMVDNAKSVLGKVTLGVFDHVKFAMSDANTWFDKHETSVMAFSEKVGEKLVYAFELARVKIREWTPAVLSFTENAYNEIKSIWDRVGPMVEKVGDALKKALADPKTFDRLETVLKLYAAVKIGGMLAPAATGAFGMAKGILGVGGSAAGAAGVAELGMAAGAAAIAIAAIAIPAYGIADALLDTSNTFHDFTTRQVEESKAYLDHMSKTIGESHAGDALKSVADASGAVAAYLGKGFLREADDFVSAIGFMTSASKSFYDKINDFLGIHLRAEPGHDPVEAKKPARDILEVLREVRDEDDKKKKTNGVPGGGGTSIQKVEIVVSTNQDPSRIARAVMDEIKGVSRNPTSSRFVRNWGAVRP